MGIYKIKGLGLLRASQKDEIIELQIFSKKRCVYKILVAFAQHCVYNKSVAFYTTLCI